MTRTSRSASAFLFAIFAMVGPPVLPAVADEKDLEPRAEILSQRIDHEGIRGTLVICGGGSLPDECRQIFAAAAGEDKPVLIIPTASGDRRAAIESAKKRLQNAGVLRIESLPHDSEPAEQIEELVEAIGRAGGVWFTGGIQSRIADAYLGTPVETAIAELVDRGGAVGGSSAGAAIMSRVMIAGGKNPPRIASGLDLLPGGIVDQHFTQRNRLGRLCLAVAQNSHCFGVGIDESTALWVHGRRVRVIGEGDVTLVLAASEHLPAAEHRMPPGALADLTQLRRAARSRASGINPGKPKLGPPKLESGSLVIVGGGGMPKEAVDRFIELAGGKEAHIVVLPTAVPRDQAMRARVPGFLARADVASVTMLPQSRTDEIEAEEFQSVLRRATGVWFDGGRQWNFVDAYENTSAVERFHGVLRRGGVIGGSSAGATIQGEYLVRGHPLGNTVMMAEGYERGFAFLPGTAIDQHFTQRSRHRDLLTVVDRHPELLAIGIDESTALIVQGSQAEVLGSHAVYLSRNSAADEDTDSGETAEVDSSDDDVDEASRRYVVVRAGQSVDLQSLEVIDPACSAD